MQSDERAPNGVIDLVPYGIVDVALDGTAISANAVWTTLTGQSGPAWRGRGWLDACHQSIRTAVSGDLLRAMRDGEGYDADWPAALLAGEPGRTLHVQAMAAADGGGHFVVTIDDVTADRARTLHLLEQATHDGLTGAFNRAQLLEFIGHALDRRRRAPERIAGVLFIDVDDLKAVNDSLGHAAGDQALRDVARCIRLAIRPTDILARYGGDEFAVLCEDLSDPAEAASIAERVRNVLAENGARSVSIGIAIADDPDTAAAAILDEADRDMYRFKARSNHPARLRLVPAPADAAPTVARTSDDRASMRLLAIAAHEMRTPLTSIIGFAALLATGSERMSVEEVSASFASLERQALRLAAMVDDLLALGSYRQTMPARGPSFLDDIVRDAVESAPAPDGVELTIFRAFGPHIVIGDRSALSRVVVNLLTNAYRYGGANITITSRACRGDEIQLVVEDDGEGVPAALAPQMFAPFVHGEARRPGAPAPIGLGLALAAEIVEAAGGRLRYEPAHPGARFTVTLQSTVSSTRVEREKTDEHR